MSKSNQKLSGNHQRCWLWGRNSVMETLRAGHWPMAELYLSETLSDEERLSTIQIADERNISVVTETRKKIENRCHQRYHQGYLAKMLEYPYATLEEVFTQSSTAPLFVILDRMHDAYNFGAVIRSAEVFGLDAVIIGSNNQAIVTSHVARSSAGAVNRVSISQVDNLLELLSSLQRRGITCVGASEKADRNLTEYDFTQPTAMILGNEGVGISPELQEHADCLLRIPQHGEIGSLNAAAAASIFFYEAQRQRKNP